MKLLISKIKQYRNRTWNRKFNKIHFDKQTKKLIAIEKIKFSFNLKKILKIIRNINEDVLNINEKLLSNDKTIVFGNLPYNISTEIYVNGF